MVNFVQSEGIYSYLPFLPFVFMAKFCVKQGRKILNQREGEQINLLIEFSSPVIHSIKGDHRLIALMSCSRHPGARQNTADAPIEQMAKSYPMFS